MVFRARRPIGRWAVLLSRKQKKTKFRSDAISDFYRSSGAQANSSPGEISREWSPWIRSQLFTGPLPEGPGALTQARLASGSNFPLAPIRLRPGPGPPEREPTLFGPGAKESPGRLTWTTEFRNQLTGGSEVEKRAALLKCLAGISKPNFWGFLVFVARKSRR